MMRQIILDHMAQYPFARLQDLIKLCYQSEFGSKHLLRQPEALATSIAAEYTACTEPNSAPLFDPIGNGLCRLHLAPCKAQGLPPDTLASLICASAHCVNGSEPSLRRTLSLLPQLCKEGRLPFSPAQAHDQVAAFLADGYQASHHSGAFQAAYAPHYRVVSALYPFYLPLLLAIDRALQEKGRIILCIDGPSGAGKSTLAYALSQIYDAMVLHMDDYFLPPERKTAARMEIPGGNVDHERFLQEAADALLAGRSFVHQSYDCVTGTLTEGGALHAAPVTIIEGVYSLHPALQHIPDLKVFLQVDAQTQERRILRRSGPEMLSRFQTQWIPLEEQYFSALDIAARCHLTFFPMPEHLLPWRSV